MNDFIYKKKSYSKKALKNKTTLIGCLAFISFIAFFVAFWHVSMWLLLFFILAIVFTCMYLRGKWILKHGVSAPPAQANISPLPAQPAASVPVSYNKPYIPTPASPQITQEVQKAQAQMFQGSQPVQTQLVREPLVIATPEPAIAHSNNADTTTIESHQNETVTDSHVSTDEPKKARFVMPDYDKEYNFKASGTSFRKDNFCDILYENYAFSMTKKELVEMGMIDERIYKYEQGGGEAELIPEPDNQYDPNAIAIYFEGTHVGYVPASKCAKVKKLMDSGTIVYVFADICDGPFKIVSENDDGKYSMSTKNHDFSVRMTLFIKNS